jgi:hypothetical protein
MPRPSPPPLPLKDQKLFEESIKRATQPTDASADDAIHPDARQPLPPDFEGDVNPITGEQGGPKQEPLKHGDWSYGGRATDF